MKVISLAEVKAARDKEVLFEKYKRNIDAMDKLALLDELVSTQKEGSMADYDALSSFQLAQRRYLFEMIRKNASTDEMKTLCDIHTNSIAASLKRFG